MTSLSVYTPLIQSFESIALSSCVSLRSPMTRLTAMTGGCVSGRPGLRVETLCCCCGCTLAHYRSTTSLPCQARVARL